MLVLPKSKTDETRTVVLLSFVLKVGAGSHIFRSKCEEMQNCRNMCDVVSSFPGELHGFISENEETSGAPMS